MGIGDNIRGLAGNAMKDLAGLSEPADDGHVPEPGDPDEDIKVHSSVSEGSNAGEGEPGAVASEDVSARDSPTGELARKIDPEMGTPEAGADPVEPQE
jgi:hypothetical protein